MRSRSPQGERGLKPEAARIETEDNCRSPQGERGLKQGYRVPIYDEVAVAPRKGSVG